MTVECPYCHEMIEETAQYCPHCGKAVIKKSKAEVTPEKEKRKPFHGGRREKKVNFSRKRHLKVQFPTSRKTFEYRKLAGNVSIHERKDFRSTFFVRWLLLLVTVGIISVVFSFLFLPWRQLFPH